MALQKRYIKTVDKFLIFEFLFKYRMNRKKQSDEISDEAVHDRIVSKDIIKMIAKDRNVNKNEIYMKFI